MRVNWLEITLIVLALASAGYAQTSRPDAPAATQPADAPAGAPAAAQPADASRPSGFLAGPRVADDGDDSNAPFTGQRRDRVAVPAGQWFRVLDRLQLDAQQRAEIYRIRRELREAMQAYRSGQGDKRQGEQAPQPAQPKTEGARAVAPSPGAYQLRIWVLLDETQQARMRAELAEVRSRIAQRRAERMETAPGDGGAPAPRAAAVELDEAGRRRLAFLEARRLAKRR